MRIKCIIIDDEQFAVNSLVNYCRKTTYLEVSATFTDPYEALGFLELNAPDLIFIDIQMPGISGLQIAKLIEFRIMFIFTTAHSQYAINGFNLNAIDFLLKPFGFKRFNDAIEKVKVKYSVQNPSALFKPESNYITVKVEYSNVLVEIDDILYIEAMDNYCRIFTSRKTITTLLSLKKLVTLLPETEFIRIHKSFVISRSKIARFTKDYVVVASKTLPIGRVYSKNILNRIVNK